MRTPAPPPPSLLHVAARQEGLVGSRQCDAAGLTVTRREALRRAGSLLTVVRGVHDIAAFLPAGSAQERSDVDRPVLGRPVLDRPVLGRSVLGRSVLGRPVLGRPVLDRPVLGRSVLGRSVLDRPVLDRSVLEIPVLERPLLERGPDHVRRRAAWLALLAVGVDRAVATGACALALHGVHGLPRRLRPEAALPDGSARRPGGGVVVRCVDPGPVTRARGARVCAVPQALAAAVRELPRDHAVAVLDSALHLGLLAADELPLVRSLVRGRRGARRTGPWWHLVDGRAESPLETRARLQCVDAGLPPHALQVLVRDASGHVVARGDLGWQLDDGRLLVVEIDGAGPHGTPRSLYRDRTRQNAVLATGALLLRYTAADVARGSIPAEIRRLLSGRPVATPS